jgi:benzoyl-CoA reductase/2-hydroxyglutaryl-CoA dehydratase subunit BcrC/BadD/HgdB
MCQLFGIEEGIVREVLKTRDIPMLTLYTDYSKEDIGQLKTRIETFIEILR